MLVPRGAALPTPDARAGEACGCIDLRHQDGVVAAQVTRGSTAAMPLVLRMYCGPKPNSGKLLYSRGSEVRDRGLHTVHRPGQPPWPVLSARRTSVPSASLGTRLAGGCVPRTTQSSRLRNRARKVSLKRTTVPVGYVARVGA